MITTNAYGFIEESTNTKEISQKNYPHHQSTSKFIKEESSKVKTYKSFNSSTLRCKSLIELANQYIHKLPCQLQITIKQIVVKLFSFKNLKKCGRSFTALIKTISQALMAENRLKGYNQKKCIQLCKTNLCSRPNKQKAKNILKAKIKNILETFILKKQALNQNLIPLIKNIVWKLIKMNKYTFNNLQMKVNKTSQHLSNEIESQLENLKEQFYKSKLQNEQLKIEELSNDELIKIYSFLEEESESKQETDFQGFFKPGEESLIISDSKSDSFCDDTQKVVLKYKNENYTLEKEEESGSTRLLSPKRDNFASAKDSYSTTKIYDSNKISKKTSSKITTKSNIFNLVELKTCLNEDEVVDADTKVKKIILSESNCNSANNSADDVNNMYKNCKFNNSILKKELPTTNENEASIFDRADNDSEFEKLIQGIKDEFKTKIHNINHDEPTDCFLECSNFKEQEGDLSMQFLDLKLEKEYDFIQEKILSTKGINKINKIEEEKEIRRKEKKLRKDCTAENLTHKGNKNLFEGESLSTLKMEPHSLLNLPKDEFELQKEKKKKMPRHLDKIENEQVEKRFKGYLKDYFFKKINEANQTAKMKNLALNQSNQMFIPINNNFQGYNINPQYTIITNNCSSINNTPHSCTGNINQMYQQPSFNQQFNGNSFAYNQDRNCIPIMSGMSTTPSFNNKCTTNINSSNYYNNYNNLVSPLSTYQQQTFNPISPINQRTISASSTTIIPSMNFVSNDYYNSSKKFNSTPEIYDNILNNQYINSSQYSPYANYTVPKMETPITNSYGNNQQNLIANNNRFLSNQYLHSQMNSNLIFSTNDHTNGLQTQQVKTKGKLKKLQNYRTTIDQNKLYLEKTKNYLSQQCKIQQSSPTTNTDINKKIKKSEKQEICDIVTKTSNVHSKKEKNISLTNKLNKKELNKAKNVEFVVNEQNFEAICHLQYLVCKSDEKIKKPLIEKKGDWICFGCKNLNFNFRTTCNICNITKIESTKLGMSVVIKEK